MDPSPSWMSGPQNLHKGTEIWGGGSPKGTMIVVHPMMTHGQGRKVLSMCCPCAAHVLPMMVTFIVITNGQMIRCIVTARRNMDIVQR